MGGHYYAHLDINRWKQEVKNLHGGQTTRYDQTGVEVGPESDATSATAHKEKWVVCDDERVKRVKKVEGRLGSSAYILFYQLREKMN